MVYADSDTVVSLTDEEWDRVVDVTTERHNEAEAHGYWQSDGTHSENGLSNHIRGGGAESGLAKYYGIAWDATINGYRSIPDLLGCCEVRSTAPNRPYLRVKLTDKGKARWIFVLLTNLGNRRYRVEGWTYGYKAMRDRYYVPVDPDSQKPEWHVPICDLNPPFTLQPVLWKLRDLKD